MSYDNQNYNQNAYNGSQHDYYGQPSNQYDQNNAPAPYPQNGFADHQQGYQQGHNQSPMPAGPGGALEGERGVLGALGGAAAGTYVGKQTCHGFLGAMGGAIVGSLTEDYAKKARRASNSSCRCTTNVHETTCIHYVQVNTPPPASYYPTPAQHCQCHNKQHHDPHCHLNHAPPPPPCHCHNKQQHEPHCHYNPYQQHPNSPPPQHGYASSTMSGSGLGVFAGKYAAQFAGMKP